MNDDLIELGKRAVACPKWRWMPGMRWWTDDDRGRLDDYQPEYMARPTDALPDLTDPATLGCLLALVREAWGPDLRIFRDGSWFVEFAPSKVPEDMYAHRTFTAHTLVDALVAALESAP